MSWLPWLQNLITFRKSSGSDLVVPRLDAAGRIQVSITDSPHDLGGAEHVADTLANLNTKVTDATLDDSGDPRDPNAHASSHQSGGGDAIKLDDLAAPDDNTDLNATTSAHGLLPKLGGGTTNYLRADGSWAAPAGGGGTDPDAIHDNVAAEINAIAQKVTPANNDALLLEDSADSYNKKRVLFSAFSGATPEVFASNESMGGQTIGDWPPTDVIFDDDFQNSNPTLFSWANDSELTINTAGKLFAVSKVSLQQTAGTGRTVPAAMLMRKTALGSYDYLWGSKDYGYNRNDSDAPYSTLVCALGFEVAAGDTIKLVAWRNSGGGTLEVVADSSTLNVMWVPI
jgi:hypothetical protein